MSVASRVEQYLSDHPDGDLLIAVGYATAAGMAWLAQRTEGRRVSLLIGNARTQYWKNVSKSDRAACLEFIRRPDVEIRNWYRTKKSRSGESDAHLKAWVVHDNGSPVSALAGSGNLTRKGLDANVEVMVEAHGSDLRQTWDTAHGLWEKAWPCAERLTKYLGGPEPPAAPPRTRATASAGGPPTATPRHATRADHASGPQPPPSPQPIPDHERAPSVDDSRAKNPVRILAVVGLVAAIGNDVALALVLRALEFSEIFSSWALPTFFVCFSLAVGAMCYWASIRAEGIDKGLAIAGVAAAALPLVAGLVALVAALVVLAITVLTVLLVLVVLATLSNR